MKNFFLLLSASAIICSCSNSANKTENAAQPKQNAIEITNDMENASAIIPSWLNEKSVIAMKEPKAHSGEFACVTNDTIEFGYTYQELVKNINSEIPKKITVTGWVFSTVTKPNLGIILDISEKQQPYDWKSFPLNEELTEVGTWKEFNASFYLDKPLNPEQVIKIFAWNQSKKPVYLDDFKITFEY